MPHSGCSALHGVNPNLITSVVDGYQFPIYVVLKIQLDLWFPVFLQKKIWT